jgi:hypothetical protein
MASPNIHDNGTAVEPLHWWAFAQCLVCEIGHGHPLPRMMVVSPVGLLHIADDSGLTLCGHDATGWVWKDTVHD